MGIPSVVLKRPSCRGFDEEVSRESTSDKNDMKTYWQGSEN